MDRRKKTKQKKTKTSCSFKRESKNRGVCTWCQLIFTGFFWLCTYRQKVIGSPADHCLLVSSIISVRIKVLTANEITTKKTKKTQNNRNTNYIYSKSSTAELHEKSIQRRAVNFRHASACYRHRFSSFDDTSFKTWQKHRTHY